MSRAPKDSWPLTIREPETEKQEENRFARAARLRAAHRAQGELGFSQRKKKQE